MTDIAIIAIIRSVANAFARQVLASHGMPPTGDPFESDEDCDRFLSLHPFLKEHIQAGIPEAAPGLSTEETIQAALDWIGADMPSEQIIEINQAIVCHANSRRDPDIIDSMMDAVKAAAELIDSSDDDEERRRVNQQVYRTVRREADLAQDIARWLEYSALDCAGLDLEDGEMGTRRNSQARARVMENLQRLGSRAQRTHWTRRNGLEDPLPRT